MLWFLLLLVETQVSSFGVGSGSDRGLPVVAIMSSYHMSAMKLFKLAGSRAQSGNGCGFLIRLCVVAWVLSLEAEPLHHLHSQTILG